MTWQPIQTAPANQQILIFEPKFARYGAGVLVATLGNGRSWHTLACSDVAPTHWMPLPNPPEGV